MGNWEKNAHHKDRRKEWGKTRGENDAVLRDFQKRAKAFPELAALRFEKIGSQIHGWRRVREENGTSWWHSCLRFTSPEYGYWTLSYRSDNRRWRATPHRELPLNKAIAAATQLLATLEQ